MLSDTVADQVGRLRRLPGAAAAPAQAFDDLAGRIAGARRLVLDDAVAVAAQNVAFLRPSSIRDAFAFARCPYPALWIEWADRPRQEAVRRAGLALAAQDRPFPRRVGVLLEAEGGGFTLTMAWEHADGSANLGAAQMVYLGPDAAVAPETVEEGFRRAVALSRRDGTWVSLHRDAPGELRAFAEITARFVGRPHPLARSVLAPFAELEARGLLPGGARGVYASHLQDLADEWLFVVATLLLLNARNGVERREETYGKLNRKRAKEGRRPYFAHEVVTLRLGRGAAAAQARGDGAAVEARRAHVVRGHFKVRLLGRGDDKRPGLVWWSSHLRGDAGVGMVLPQHVRVRL